MSSLLPLFQLKDPTVMQWQTRWKALLDPLLGKSGLNIVTGPIITFTSSTPNTANFIPNSSTTLSSTGGPIVISFQGQLSAINTLGSYSIGDGTLYIVRDFANDEFNNFYTLTGLHNSITFVDSVPKGQHTYQLYYQLGPSGSVNVSGMQFVLYELGT